MSKKLPIVALVGRANVGKSSLFNAVLDRREAIVSAEPGTTRDSISAKASWEGNNFWLVDTAGVKDAADDFELTIQEQITQAVDAADIIWVIVEANVPITEEDRRVARTALKSKKPVFLVINKVDRARGHDLEGFERLGIRPILPTSTTQNRGIAELLDTLLEHIPHLSQPDETSLRIALLGRPNVGKSTLFNALAKKQQAIVADKAGTTRDINRAGIRYNSVAVELMDTAGIRRSGKIGKGIEHFSVIRSLAAIEQADVCLLLTDVNELGTALDQKIAGMVEDAGKGLVIVVSKWDSVEGKDAFTRDALAPKIAQTFDFVPWAPLLFTSAETGQNVTKIFDIALDIWKARQTRLTTSELNNWLGAVTASHPPSGLKNRAPKLNYMVQETDNPTPAFKIFGSHTKYVHWSYRRYMERELREEFGFEGSALQLWFIEKSGRHKHGNSPTKPERTKTQRKIITNKQRTGKLKK
ncbi:MAG TPA: ribosome biogenesis GTPase Der [Candidatus Saccharibacteria bacterium]|nr:ribosome biogenesis GTPase Der [Candidatus Saccharibacteria bacterium]